MTPGSEAALGATMADPAPRRLTILLIAGLAWSLVNFRLDLMRRMVANGHRVLAAAPDFDPETEAALRAAGIEPLDVPMQRTGLNPISDLQTLSALRKLIRDRRPAARSAVGTRVGLGPGALARKGQGGPPKALLFRQASHSGPGFFGLAP